MSGKMKKLICALLTSTMIVTSIGLVGFAADESTTDTESAEVTSTAAPEEETEATEAPAEAEATEAPAETEETEATEAPTTTTTVESTEYDSDSYYQKALALCQGLGIITGYDDGTIRPESTVTRAEMAAIVLRMLNSTSSSTYQNVFTDVADSHWAAGTIQTASSLGIVNGMGDGTFQPDGDVLYEQVAKMLVCAMNYGDSAEYYGGYPNGYLKQAASLDITKNATGTTGVAAERGLVIKMVYNALLADYNEPDGTDNGYPKYKAERTLAEYAFDVQEEKGVLLGTETTSLTNKNLTSGQVLIVSDDDEEVVYDTELVDLDSLLASNITFYYQNVDNGDTRVLLAVAENTTKTETVTLDNDDVADIEIFEGFDGTAGQIKVYNKTKYKLSKDIQVVYNGTIIDEEDYNSAVSSNSGDPRFYYEDEDGETQAYEYIEFLQPKVGTIKLVENNSDVDGYDYIFIDSYETMLVTSATTKKVIGNINNTATTINVDEDENDLTISTTISGTTAAPRNLKKNNVVSIKRSIDNENLQFVVTGETVTGTVKSISTDDDKTYATIGGVQYEVDANAIDDCKMGSEAVFYLDMFDRIGYIESTTSDGMLQSGESYGWILSIYDSDDGEDIIVKLYTMDGESVEAKLKSTVSYWGPSDSEASTAKAEDIKSELTTTSGSTTTIKNNAFLLMNSTPIRLVKYKLNSSSELSKLYCAVDSTDVDDEDALRINPTNLSNVASLSGAVSGYNIVDGIIEFNVPSDTDDMKTASNYSIGEVVASNYVVRENGSSRDFVVGEFKNSINANIVINFNASGSAKAVFSDMDSSGNGPSVMVVNAIYEGYDEDEDMTIYTISGYIGGSQVSVTTNKNTNFGDAKTSSIWGGTSNRYFQADERWNAPDAQTSGAKLTDGEYGLKKGDILLYTTDGKLLLRYASAANAEFDEETGEFIESSIPIIGVNNATNSTSRVHYMFDMVTDHDLDDVAWVKLAGITDTITFDASMAIDVVTISSSGKINIEKEVSSISEIEDGDYLFVNHSDKGSTIKAMIIYRFE